MDWHNRFLQQAAWTKDIRRYLFEHAGLKQATRVLEVGCGTGAILADLVTPATVCGLDLDPARVSEARTRVPLAKLMCGDALALPFPGGVFEITFCHFLLLWVRDPLQALREMRRVTRPGGAVLALAEPDYCSRVDKPAALVQLGRLQTESLRQQGADPGVGKNLGELFTRSGILLAETGTLGEGGALLPSRAEREMEWEVLEADLQGRVPASELGRLKRLDEQAWERGERVLQVPTHFAWGIA
jgi:SAM-dependent methyltransferase